jgi:hypothetical protein
LADSVDGMTTPNDHAEREEFLSALAKHRGFLRQTLDGLGDEQAAQRSTVSELCLGGIIKHMTRGEHGWIEFVVNGPKEMAVDENTYEKHAASFRMEPGETVAMLLADYETVARETEKIVRGLPSLNVSNPLPSAPWFEPGASWSARRVLLHVLAETSQHAGHADIIREAIDGAKTMG